MSPRRAGIAQRQQHVADALVAHRDVAPGLRRVVVGGADAFALVQAGAKGRQRTRRIPAAQQGLAHPVVRDRQLPPPVATGAIERHQRGHDLARRGRRRQRRRRIAAHQMGGRQLARGHRLQPAQVGQHLGRARQALLHRARTLDHRADRVGREAGRRPAAHHHVETEGLRDPPAFERTQRAVALVGRHPPRRARRRCRPRQAQGAPLQAQLLREQVFLGHAPHHRGKIRRARHEVLRPRRGPQSPVAHIHPSGFVGEAPLERRRQGRLRRPGEIARRLVPAQLPRGQREQQRVRPPVRQPVLDLQVHPARRRGLGRGEQDQEARAVEGIHDRRPQRGRRGQAGVVAEHPQGPPPIPGLAQPLHHVLQRGRDPAITRVAV